MIPCAWNYVAIPSQQSADLRDHGVALNQNNTFRDVFTGKPLIDIVKNGIHPFEDGTKHFGPKGHGVICIENIPYNVTKMEIEHFLGKNAGLILAHVVGCPIHIIMERPTSKTMDCYVEVYSDDAAVAAFKRHENSVSQGRHPRLGQRHVEVVVADQDELMKALFPRARSLVWENGYPRKIENMDPYSSGYQGFLTTEEMIGMVRHAETPQRSPFSVKCLQRTFECMISTLYKFPWHAQHMYTLKDRNMLYKTYMLQLTVLVEKVAESQTVGLDMRLLMDFLFAGVNCPGFGERMKHSIVLTARHVGAGLMVSQLSSIWPFEVLGKPRFAPDGAEWHRDIIMFFVYIIELGFSDLRGDFVHSDHIRAMPPAPVPFPLYDKLATNTRFEFKEEVNNRSFDEIVKLEENLMHALIDRGFTVWSNSMRRAMQNGEITGEIDRDIKIFMQLNEWNSSKIEWEEEQLRVAQATAATDQLTQAMSPAESPKGTTTTEQGFYDGGNDISQLTHSDIESQQNSKAKGIDPTVNPFKPLARRMSESQLPESDDPFVTPVKHKNIFEHPFYTPGPNFRRNSSAAVEIRRPDDPAVEQPVGTIGAHLSSPIKMRTARGGFCIDRTIDEGSEEGSGNEQSDGEDDIIMMAGKRRQSSSRF